MDKNERYDKHHNSDKSDNEYSDNEGGMLAVEKDTLRKTLMHNLDIMKRTFKKNGLELEDLLDKNQILNVLDGNMENGRIFDRYAAAKIYSVQEWDKEERVSM